MSQDLLKERSTQITKILTLSNSDILTKILENIKEDTL